jgi:dehydratase
MHTPLRLRACLAATLGIAAVLAGAAPAVAAPTTVPWDCQARPPIGGPQQLNLPTDVDGTAPATVASGGALEIVLTPQPLTVPTTANGFAVASLKDVTLKAPIPANSTLSGVTLTGGSGLGTAPPKVAVAGGFATLTVPGPLAGGAVIQLPAIHLALTATGAAGSTITSTVAGTSYTDPGLTFTANVKIFFGTIPVPGSCYAHPVPTLTSTTIA